MSDELLRELKRTERASNNLKKIIKRCRTAYETINGSYWSHTFVAQLVERLTAVWLDCGHTVKTTLDGEFDEYLKTGYWAAFNKDIGSSSNLLETAKRFADARKSGRKDTRA